MSTQQAKIQELIDKRAEARLGGGEKAIDKQHAKGKYTAASVLRSSSTRAALKNLTCLSLIAAQTSDKKKSISSATALSPNFGTIDGRLVYIFAQDFTVFGGSLSETMALKICKVMDPAMKMGAPCIGLNDSGGARIQEGINALAGYAEIFQRNIMASGVIPRISAILGFVLRWSCI